tara:strand:+ start:852 stop:1091 length:240 start_codon:yes stop_codon:yes gene_type:complete
MNLDDMIEDYLSKAAGTKTGLLNANRVVAWGVKNGLVKEALPSKGTDYNWQLSRRIKRDEADKLRSKKRLQDLLARCTS